MHYCAQRLLRRPGVHLMISLVQNLMSLSNLLGFRHLTVRALPMSKSNRTSFSLQELKFEMTHLRHRNHNLSNSQILFHILMSFAHLLQSKDFVQEYLRWIDASLDFADNVF